jgi:hypothetical protein
MKPSEILRQLRADHDELRALVRDTRASADEYSRGEVPFVGLQTRLATLLEAVGTHNRREEHLIREVLPTLGGWDVVRAKFITLDHLQEHGEIYNAISGFHSTTHAPAASQPLLTLLDSLLLHIDHEEEVFIRPEVLRDEPG